MIKAIVANTIKIESDDKGIKTRNFDDSLKFTLRWIDIDDVKVSEYRVLLFINDKIEHTLNQDSEGWHKLIKDVPQGFESYDYFFVRDLLESLDACSICGLQAVQAKKCFACGCAVWDNKLSGEVNEQQYIKESQLVHFMSFEQETIELNNRPKFGFNSALNWKSLITIDEVEKGMD